jgi:uncharacterized membrane protein YphA (DoxX/SURF4 family)
MTNIGYWATTGLVAIAFASSGAANLTRSAGVLAGMTRLGYPSYLATLLGVWQLLGAVAILVPGLPRLKEWAYAGMFFDLSGAIVSHLVMADRLDKILGPLALLGVAIGSWAQRPESRILRTLGEVPKSFPTF